MRDPDPSVDAVDVRGTMEEAVVRAVHGFCGVERDAVRRAVNAANKAAAGLGSPATMTTEETAEYVRMVTLPGERERGKFVARPGFVLTYGLRDSREAEKRSSSGTTKTKTPTTAGMKRGKNVMIASVSASGANSGAKHARVGADGARKNGAGEDGRGAGEASERVDPSFSEELEMALAKTLKSAEVAENAQSVLEDLMQREINLKNTLKDGMRVKRAVKTDLSGMPNFEFDEEKKVYNGDPSDRHALLSHKKFVEAEMNRLQTEKANWIAEKKRKARLKEKAQRSANANAELKKLKEKVANAKREANRAVSVATSDAKHLENLKSKIALTSAQMLQVSEREALRAKKLLEQNEAKAMKMADAAAKAELLAQIKAEKAELALKEKADRAERLAKEKAERAERLAKEKAEAARLRRLFPMEDSELVKYDAEEAKRQGREPWPSVPSFPPWEPRENDLDHMEICEFVNTFANEIFKGEVSELDVKALREMLAEPSSRQLNHIYVGLLYAAVTTVSEHYGALVTMWQESLDQGTYPEVLQHYFKVKRRLGLEETDCYKVVLSLEDRVLAELTPAEHSALLISLCRDSAASELVRELVDSRVNTLDNLRRKRQREDARAVAYDKQREKLLIQAKPEGTEKTDTANEGELNAIQDNDPNIKSTSSPGANEPDSMQLSETKVDEEHEAELKRREDAIHQRNNEDATFRIRPLCLGVDRNQSKYYWNFASNTSAIFQWNVDQTWAKITTEDEFEALRKSLNKRGVREKRLLKRLEITRKEILDVFNAEGDGMVFPKSTLTRSKNEEMWLEIARRETEAMESLRSGISLLMADVVEHDAVAPDGTMSGWRIWGRELTRTSALEDLRRHLLQMEDTVADLGETPKDIINSEGSAIEWTNKRLREANQQVENHLEDEVGEPLPVYEDLEWWELIIPTDSSKQKKHKRVWDSNQQRAIWREAMENATCMARLAYGCAMLTSFSRSIFLSLGDVKAKKRRSSMRDAEYRRTIAEFEADGYKLS